MRAYRLQPRTRPPPRDDLDRQSAARVAAVTAPTTDFSKPRDVRGPARRRRKRCSGPANSDAFTHPLANLTFEQHQRFLLGNGIFKKIWVSAPSSTRSSDGLGPLYNARACQRCHLKDGRGHPPNGLADTATSLIIQLSVPPRTEAERQALTSNQLSFLPEADLRRPTAGLRCSGPFR